MTRIGLSPGASQILVEEQGIDTLSEIRLLSDSEIESLCKIIRRPGCKGNGTPVNQRAEVHLKHLAFYLRHKASVSRQVEAATITLDDVRALREIRDFEESYKETDEAPSINGKDWPKTIESIEEYLRSYLGDRKIPLAYVIRKEVNIPSDDDTVTYPTVHDEMIARAPHTMVNAASASVADPTYLINSGKVWDVLSKICRDHSSWTYIKDAQQTRDGRKVFLALKQHYLRAHNVHNMATLAEDKLKNTAYHGEQRCWDFERYVNIHMQQHSIMEGLKDHGYTGIDPRSKVRFLIDGIKTDKFDAVKTCIMSDAHLRNDFDSCVNLYQDTFDKLPSPRPMSPSIFPR